MQFLWELLQLVIIAAVTALTPFLVKFIIEKASQLKAGTKNELIASSIDNIAIAVADAIAYTNQTYVDELKKSKTFSVENQKEALQKSLEVAEKSLTESARKYIQTTYGNVAEYLTVKIESDIKKSKEYK